MKALSTVILVLIICSTITGCKKEKSNIPQFQFITGTGYTSSNATVAAGQRYTIGFTAIQPENGDALKEIKGSYTVNDSTGIMAGFDYDLTNSPNTFNTTSTYFAPDNTGDTYNYTFILHTTGEGTRTLKISITAI